MPRSRFIAHDDALDIELRGRAGESSRPRWPSIRLSHSRGMIGLQAIVKVSYFRAARVAGYVQYIERDGTAGPAARDGTNAAQGYSGYIGRAGAGDDGQRAMLFTRAGPLVDRETFVQDSQGDPRAWTIIVSPGSNDLDMERYVREFMVQVEIDLGRKLEYLAAVHRNTDFTHAHVLLRGNDRAGQEFRMPRAYIGYGLRLRATEIATRARELGWVRSTPTRGAKDTEVSLPRTLARWMTSHAREGHER